MTSPDTSHRFAVVVTVAVGAVLMGLISMPGAAMAHTDFDFSLPTDGASVGVPVDEVTVAFTSPVALVGNGFEALDPQGNVVQPFAVTDDDQVFRLQFEPSLTGGAVGVRYEVRADDGHVLSGSFSFVVDAPVSTTAPTVSTTQPTTTTPVVVDTTQPATTAPVVVDTAAPATDSQADGAPPVAEPSIAPAAPSGDDASPGDGGAGTGVILVIAIAAIVGAAGFYAIRSRSPGVS